MNLIKISPFSTSNISLEGLVDDLFNRSIGEVVGSDFVNNNPSVNIVESENETRIELAAPGLEKKDFQLQVEENKLVIQVEKSAEKSEETESFRRREFSYRGFSRSFDLDNNTDQENISASYSNGILAVTLPKTIDQKVTGKVIEIV